MAYVHISYFYFTSILLGAFCFISFAYINIGNPLSIWSAPLRRSISCMYPLLLRVQGTHMYMKRPGVTFCLCFKRAVKYCRSIAFICRLPNYHNFNQTPESLKRAVKNCIWQLRFWIHTNNFRKCPQLSWWSLQAKSSTFGLFPW